uniref:Uncharacterized protein n=1 Tax=Tanacetum cinerariifolium TaxID=118510 RepID=A0A699S9L2_TANCI|nr:hypothetical protein [Tanacetum cinerariifolium]
MPPRILRKKSVKKLVERRVAKAIEEYDKTRADSINAGGSGSARCSWTETLVEKMEQVFKICKCTKDDKVKFAMCTLEGRALRGGTKMFKLWDSLMLIRSLGEI